MGKHRLKSLAPRIGTLSPLRRPIPCTVRLTGRPGQRARLEILERDRYLCQPCLKEGKVCIADEVDHIVPLSQGGSDAPANKQAINHECHAKKSARENVCARP